METHPYNRRNFLRVLCSSTTGSDVIQGVGSVMVLGGTTLMVTGAIFSGVAYSGTDATSSSSFRLMGPLLIGLSAVIIGVGYSMCHFSDLKQMWLFYKRRKQMAYIRKRDITDDITEDFRVMPFKGALCAICFQCLLCVIIRRYRNSSPIVSAENQDVELGPKTTAAAIHGRNEKFSSLGSLRQCKVSPEPVYTESNENSLAE